MALARYARRVPNRRPRGAAPKGKGNLCRFPLADDSMAGYIAKNKSGACRAFPWC